MKWTIPSKAQTDKVQPRRDIENTNYSFREQINSCLETIKVSEEGIANVHEEIRGGDGNVHYCDDDLKTHMSYVKTYQIINLKYV